MHQIILNVVLLFSSTMGYVSVCVLVQRRPHRYSTPAAIIFTNTGVSSYRCSAAALISQAVMAEPGRQPTRYKCNGVLGRVARQD